MHAGYIVVTLILAAALASAAVRSSVMYTQRMRSAADAQAAAATAAAASTGTSTVLAFAPGIITPSYAMQCAARRRKQALLAFAALDTLLIMFVMFSWFR
jgi:hypothetical protein